MANPSVTYTFSNGTTADASQVNTNFTDLINSLTDGNKSLTIDALAVGGAATFAGNVTLGNGTPDDITISGSLAATIAVKTTFSYDLGSSTIGWKSFYLGSDDSAARTVRIIAGTIGTSYTLTLPIDGGTDGYGLESSGSGTTVWRKTHFQPGYTQNLAIVNATTTNANDSIKITGADGTTLSSSNPGFVALPSTTQGQTALFKITSDVTINLTGAHWGLGTFGDQTNYILHVYAINNAGSIKWGVCATGALSVILDANDSTTATSITTTAGILVNSALSADDNAREIGYFKANFDDTGGAAEDLWSVQTSVGSIVMGVCPPVWKNYVPTTQGFGTLANTHLQWLKDGNMLRIRGRTDLGTVTASEGRWGFPSGWSTITWSTGIELAGHMIKAAASASQWRLLIESGVSYFTFSLTDASNNPFSKKNGNDLNNNDTVSIQAEAQISGWV